MLIDWMAKWGWLSRRVGAACFSTCHQVRVLNLLLGGGRRGVVVFLWATEKRWKNRNAIEREWRVDRSWSLHCSFKFHWKAVGNYTLQAERRNTSFWMPKRWWDQENAAWCTKGVKSSTSCDDDPLPQLVYNPIQLEDHLVRVAHTQIYTHTHVSHVCNYHMTDITAAIFHWGSSLRLKVLQSRSRVSGLGASQWLHRHDVRGEETRGSSREAPAARDQCRWQSGPAGQARWDHCGWRRHWQRTRARGWNVTCCGGACWGRSEDLLCVLRTHSWLKTCFLFHPQIMIPTDWCVFLFFTTGSGGLSSNPVTAGLTTDHKPDHPKERARIERCGGKVEIAEGGVARVNGNLAVSRGFGDKDGVLPIILHTGHFFVTLWVML